MIDIEELFKYNEFYYNKELQKIFSNFPDISLILSKKVPVVIHGAGTVGKAVLKKLLQNRIKVIAFSDSNSRLWRTYIDKVKIISPEELKNNYFNSPILIASVIYEAEIYEMLRERGFPYLYPLTYLNYVAPGIFDFRNYNERYKSLFFPESQREILKVNNLWEDQESKGIFYNLIKFRLSRYYQSSIGVIESKFKEYFEPGILSFSQEEVFLDCGAYMGGVIKDFYEEVSGKFKKIYAFEPDKTNFKKLNEIVKKIDPSRILPINSGIYHSTGSVNFCELGTPESGIGSEQSFFSLSGLINENIISICVVSIDDFLKDKEPATFIKMDIEGSETDGLMGAKKIIKEYKPKLAICVYHKATDLWKIPLLIKNLNKDYSLYLRHYSREICETVCYAV